MANIGEQIREVALELLKQKPEGLKFGQLIEQIHAKNSDFKRNTMNGNIWDLHEQYPEKVCKPSRGLFRLVEYNDPKTGQLKQELTAQPPKKIHEEDFYRAFADWLVKDMEDCTKAISLGGNRFKDKWGTPDVIGKRQSRPSDIIRVPDEIVAAEIKLDTSQLVTAFGQACAYCLFAHKSYLVIPKDAPDDEIARIDALCLVFGIGLVLYNNKNVEVPNFEILARPQRHDPDMFYVNKNMKFIESELFN